MTKEWYQYRFEEISNGSDLEVYHWLNNLFFRNPSISKRLCRFLFVKLHCGGIKWQWRASLTDFRGVYGCHMMD